MPLSLPTSPRYDLDAPIVAHRQLIENEFELAFYAPQIAAAARPGQFIELLYGENYAPLVRRPFSLYRVDRAAGVCSILYRQHGSFTSSLRYKQPGDTLSILGPLGRGFRWTSNASDRRVLVAGGIGAPPIYFLASDLSNEVVEAGGDPATITVINAARTRELLIGLTEFEALSTTLVFVTDDGSHGRQGRAPELLAGMLDGWSADERTTYVYSCGPMPMLRAIAELTLERGVSCQMSVETSMPCGIGTCQGCAIPVADANGANGLRYALACVDGPVFEARYPIW